MDVCQNVKIIVYLVLAINVYNVLLGSDLMLKVHVNHAHLIANNVRKTLKNVHFVRLNLEKSLMMVLNLKPVLNVVLIIVQNADKIILSVHFAVLSNMQL